MTRRFVLTFILVVQLPPSIGWAYEVNTHSEMSRAAFQVSVLNNDPQRLSSLGISSKDGFPNSRIPDKKWRIIDLFAMGANFEDGFTPCDARPRNHFFDPIYNRGLNVGGISGQRSPDWALEDIGVTAEQEFSLRDARDHFYKALTLPTQKERDRHFGLTFQTLGQVIHHLQDMAQPQHVRNDLHINFGECWLKNIFGLAENPSLYEQYTKVNTGSLPYTGYRSLLFATPRRFWTTGDGRGMADFTNANFVSAGTNYELRGSQPASNRQYAEPFPFGFGAPVPIAQLLAEEGQTTTLTGTVNFVENAVWDRNTDLQINRRSASYSIFDADLAAYNATVTYTWLGPRVTVDRLFTLNRFNFKAAYPHLIPKAVAHTEMLADVEMHA